MSMDGCLDLLHNLLSPEENERALEHLTGCPRCEKMLEEMAGRRERLRSTRPLGIAADGRLVVDTPREAPAGVPEDGAVYRGILRRLWHNVAEGFLRPRYRLSGGLVAAVCVLLLVVLWPHGKGPGDGHMLHWLPASLSDTRFRTGAGSALNEELSAGLEAYAGRDLDSAVDLLESAEVSGSLETIRKIYLGSALAWNGRHSEAVSVLTTIPARTLPDPWGVEAHWTLYISLWESGNKAGADSLLHLLAEEPGEIGQRARGALEKPRGALEESRGAPKESGRR